MQNAYDLIEEFQDTMDNLIIDCGSSPKVYLGADLNIDIDMNPPRDKHIFKKIADLLKALALEDILRVKHS